MPAARDPGIITLRPFEERDLEAAAELCERARAQDASVEPFSQRLALIASGPRALLSLWRVAEGEDGALHAISFAALREALRAGAPDANALHFAPQRGAAGPPEPVLPAAPSVRATASRARTRGTYAGAPALAARADPPASQAPPPQPRRTSVELYAAVMPALRRQGLGRQLLEPALSWAREQAARGPVALRARVRDVPGARAGLAFLRALGFAESSAQLFLGWSGTRAPAPREVPELALRPLDARDAGAVADFQRLSDAAWEGAEEAFPSRADELAQLAGELDRLILLARVNGQAAGYLSAMRLGRALGIEEVAVLPEYRRFGIGRALVVEALHRAAAPSAVLTVSEKNRPARALYRSLGFIQSGRRLIFEWSAGPEVIDG